MQTDAAFTIFIAYEDLLMSIEAFGTTENFTYLLVL